MMKVIGLGLIALLLLSFGWLLFRDFCVGSCVRQKVFPTEAQCEWVCKWSRG